MSKNIIHSCIVVIVHVLKIKYGTLIRFKVRFKSLSQEHSRLSGQLYKTLTKANPHKV